MIDQLREIAKKEFCGGCSFRDDCSTCEYGEITGNRYIEEQ